MSGLDPHRFYPRDIEVFSIASSNATQSDLPGPGRNLGNLYSFLGRYLEGFLNGVAQWRGLGPNAVAARIKKEDYELRRDRRRSKRTVAYAKKEQKRDMKKLIRYTKSRTESTRKQALENIIDFAWRDEHFRDLLKALNAAQVIKAQEPYIWDYCDPSVQISSRLALICVEEVRLFRSEWSLPPWLEKVYALAEYMRLNPEQSFLVLRLFTRYMEDLALDVILTEVETLISTSPEQIEWEEVDKVYEYWFRECFSSLGTDAFVLFRARVFEPFRRICLSAPNLPRTIQSSLFQSWIRGLEDPEDHVPHLRLEHFLRSAEAENMSRENALISLSPFTQALNEDEADVVLCGMFAPSITYDGLDIARIDVCTEVITSGCVKLAEFLNSGDQRIAHRAFVCCRIVLMTGIYPRTQMLKSLASTAFAGCTEYVRLIDVTGRKCQPSGISYIDEVSRHCDDQGNLIHITNAWASVRNGSPCTNACSSVHELFLHRQGVMGFELKRGDPVTAPSGVMPILAGHFSDGRRAFLCRRRPFKYLAVAEGTEAEFGLYLLTLRYALDTYSRPHGPGEFVASEDQGLDATGPYSWKFDRYLTEDDSILWTD